VGSIIRISHIHPPRVYTDHHCLLSVHAADFLDGCVTAELAAVGIVLLGCLDCIRPNRHLVRTRSATKQGDVEGHHVTTPKIVQYITVEMQ
jgi:hypothetical protein